VASRWSSDPQRLSHELHPKSIFLGCNSHQNVVRYLTAEKNGAPRHIDRKCFPRPNGDSNTVAGFQSHRWAATASICGVRILPGARPSGPLNNQIKFASSTNMSGVSKQLRIAILVPSGTGVEL